MPAAGDVLTITVRAAPWIPVSTRFASSPPPASASCARCRSRPIRSATPASSASALELPLADLGLAADDWVVIEAGLPLPPYADLDDDGVVDTGDNDGDGDIDTDDVEDDEDEGPITNPPDPTDPTDPRFHMTRIVPDSWPIGFTSPLLIDLAGDGWTPPAR